MIYAEALELLAEEECAADGDLQLALRDGRLRHICVTPAFLGFFGVAGVLPYHYTQDIAEQIRDQRWEGTRAFFDMLSQRLVSHYYLAWSKHRLVQATTDDPLLPLQLALAGSRYSAVLCDEVAAHYAAVLRQRPVSASAMAAVLSDYFDLPLAIEQFVGHWDELPEDQQSMLGCQNAGLLAGAMLGQRCWDRQARARLRLGPLSMAQFTQFLPGGEGLLALRAFLALFATGPVQFDICPVLRAADVRDVQLTPACPARLGMHAFLLGAADNKDRADLTFALPA